MICSKIVLQNATMLKSVYYVYMMTKRNFPYFPDSRIIGRVWKAGGDWAATCENCGDSYVGFKTRLQAVRMLCWHSEKIPIVNPELANVSNLFCMRENSRPEIPTA